MSEWQSAADKGDAEGQLGLGKLYEFGLGDLAQNYKRADFWYRKAADQNNAEAQYRLALIWAVGGDDFPPDLAEAYKWLVLAVESKGVWGTRATEVKPQFDRLVGFADQAKGKKLAAEWKDEHAKAAAPIRPRKRRHRPLRPPVLHLAPAAARIGRSQDYPVYPSRHSPAPNRRSRRQSHQTVQPDNPRRNRLHSRLVRRRRARRLWKSVQQGADADRLLCRAGAASADRLSRSTRYGSPAFSPMAISAFGSPTRRRNCARATSSRLRCAHRPMRSTCGSTISRSADRFCIYGRTTTKRR